MFRFNGLIIGFFMSHNSVVERSRYAAEKNQK